MVIFVPENQLKINNQLFRSLNNRCCISEYTGLNNNISMF